MNSGCAALAENEKKKNIFHQNGGENDMQTMGSVQNSNGKILSRDEITGGSRVAKKKK